MQERERFRVGLERMNDYSGQQKGRYAVGWDTPQRLGCSFIYAYAAWLTVNDMMSLLCVYFLILDRSSDAH